MLSIQCLLSSSLTFSHIQFSRPALNPGSSLMPVCYPVSFVPNISGLVSHLRAYALCCDELNSAGFSWSAVEDILFKHLSLTLLDLLALGSPSSDTIIGEWRYFLDTKLRVWTEGDNIIFTPYSYNQSLDRLILIHIIKLPSRILDVLTIF